MRGDGLQFNQRPTRVLQITDADRRGAGDSDVDAVDVRAVGEMQSTPHPVHGPPVAHSPRVVALTGNLTLVDLSAVDGDGAGHRARDLIARRDPVLIRRAR